MCRRRGAALGRPGSDGVLCEGILPETMTCRATGSAWESTHRLSGRPLSVGPEARTESRPSRGVGGSQCGSGRTPSGVFVLTRRSVWRGPGGEPRETGRTSLVLLHRVRHRGRVLRHLLVDLRGGAGLAPPPSSLRRDRGTVVLPGPPPRPSAHWCCGPYRDSWCTSGSATGSVRDVFQSQCEGKMSTPSGPWAWCVPRNTSCPQYRPGQVQWNVHSAGPGVQLRPVGGGLSGGTTETHSRPGPCPGLPVVTLGRPPTSPRYSDVSPTGTLRSPLRRGWPGEDTGVVSGRTGSVRRFRTKSGPTARLQHGCNGGETRHTS